MKKEKKKKEKKKEKKTGRRKEVMPKIIKNGVRVSGVEEKQE